jgi:hypothetical protein
MAFSRKVPPGGRELVRRLERRLNNAVDELVYAVLGGPTPAAKALGITPASVHETISRGFIKRRDAALRWAAVAARNGHPIPAAELMGLVNWMPELRTRGGMVRPTAQGRLPVHVVPTREPGRFATVYDEETDRLGLYQPPHRFFPMESQDLVDLDGAPLRPTSVGGGMERIVYAPPEERRLPGPGAATVRQIQRGAAKKKVTKLAKAKKRGKARAKAGRTRAGRKAERNRAGMACAPVTSRTSHQLRFVQPPSYLAAA